MSYTITSKGEPVSVVRFNEPHECAPGEWHGEFQVPTPPAAPQAQQFNQAPKAPDVSEHWLGVTIAVECEAAKVPEARVVCVRGTVIEWEGVAA
jgi:hypothetical protein